MDGEGIVTEIQEAWLRGETAKILWDICTCFGAFIVESRLKRGSPDVTWWSVNCHFRFEFQIQADKPVLIGYCGHPHFDRLVSSLLLAISRSIRSKNENAKTSHSRLDQLSEISFWKNKKKMERFLQDWKICDMSLIWKAQLDDKLPKVSRRRLENGKFRREIRTGRVWGQ